MRNYISFEMYWEMVYLLFLRNAGLREQVAILSMGQKMPHVACLACWTANDEVTVKWGLG